MNLYVFHYHLLPGGVTTVIRDGARALLSHPDLIPELRRVVVVAAGSDGGGLAEPIEHRRLDALGYEDAPATTDGQRQLADLLRLRFGDGVWWIHNHHLAKNTRFTGAVVLAAAAGQPIILQIHDFPENARPANLRRLLREVPGSSYPSGDNVRYAVLNRRDWHALTAAGCPEERVVVLANPVRAAAPVPAADSEPARTARARLAGAALADPPVGTGHCEPGHPLWLYPVRVRRRKNVLEAGLLARLAEVNLLVTLAASSRAEAPYAQQVEKLFAGGAIPGLYGVGEGLERCGLRFEDLLAAAHLIVSPSIEEGFGFQFVNALQWRRPLLARRLPVFDDLAELLAGYPAVIYDAVQCPLSAGERRALRTAYGPALERAERLLPEARFGRLRAALETIISDDTVDYSYLDVAQQADLLRRCGDAGFRRELREANADLLAAVRALPGQPLPDCRQRIETAYGETPFARRSAALLAPLAASDRLHGAPATGSATARIDPAAVREAFTTPVALRLLMES